MFTSPFILFRSFRDKKSEGVFTLPPRPAWLRLLCTPLAVRFLSRSVSVNIYFSSVMYVILSEHSHELLMPVQFLKLHLAQLLQLPVELCVAVYSIACAVVPVVAQPYPAAVLLSRLAQWATEDVLMVAMKVVSRLGYKAFLLALHDAIRHRHHLPQTNCIGWCILQSGSALQQNSFCSFHIR